MIKMTFDNWTMEELGGYIGNRKFWDPYCREWESSDMESRLIYLGYYVQNKGRLYSVINKYAKEHDAIYKRVIQHAILFYLGALMIDDEYFSDFKLRDRIQCLDRRELVELLSKELKRNVQKTFTWNDSKGTMVETWLVGKEHLNDDSILDNIERRHWRNNPEEAFSEYQRRRVLNWEYEENSKSLW